MSMVLRRQHFLLFLTFLLVLLYSWICQGTQLWTVSSSAVLCDQPILSISLEVAKQWGRTLCIALTMSIMPVT